MYRYSKQMKHETQYETASNIAFQDGNNVQSIDYIGTKIKEQSCEYDYTSKRRCGSENTRLYT